MSELGQKPDGSTRAHDARFGLVRWHIVTDLAKRSARQGVPARNEREPRDGPHPEALLNRSMEASLGIRCGSPERSIPRGAPVELVVQRQAGRVITQRPRPDDAIRAEGG